MKYKIIFFSSLWFFVASFPTAQRTPFSPLRGLSFQHGCCQAKCIMIDYTLKFVVPKILYLLLRGQNSSIRKVRGHRNIMKEVREIVISISTRLFTDSVFHLVAEISHIFGQLLKRKKFSKM